MSRHTLRETAMTCLYQHFLLNGDIKSIVFENAGNEIDPFLYTVTIDALKHKDFYIKKINRQFNSFIYIFFRKYSLIFRKIIIIIENIIISITHNNINIAFHKKSMNTITFIK